MRRFLAALSLVLVFAVNAEAGEPPTLQGYARASTDRGCLTSETSGLLTRMESRFGRVQIVSTCRSGAVIAGTRKPSYHRYGMAVDFQPPRGRKSEVVRWLYAQGALVMTYARMGHVHFNVGQGARIAYGGGGKKARHAKRRGARYAGLR